MADNTPSTDAGAGAEALLGLAGQAVRLPSLPTLPPPKISFLPHPVTPPQPVSHPQPPSHPQTLPSHTNHPPSSQHSQLQSSQPPQQPPAMLPPRPERLPSMTEWTDPLYRPYQPPLLAPIPDASWPNSAPLPSPPYTYPHPPHPPWPPQHYQYAHPHYYYYQQAPHPAQLSYPPQPASIHQPPPPPLSSPAVPAPSVVPPLRVPPESVSPPNASTSSLVPMSVQIPPARTVPMRDPLMQRLTTEVAISKDDPPPPSSRPTNLADLMNPTDTCPSTIPSLDLQPVATASIAKPEPLEKITPGVVQVPPLPNLSKPQPISHMPIAQPKQEDSQALSTSAPNKLALSVITGAIDNVESAMQRSEPHPALQNPVGKNEVSQQHTSTPAKSQTQDSGKLTNDGNALERTQKDTTSATDMNGHSALRMAQSRQHVDEKSEKDETSNRRKHINRDNKIFRRPSKIEDATADVVVRHDGDDDDDDDENSEETRCPCGSTDTSGFMIACDECNTWQHGRCMGFRRKADLTDEPYFCHICRPEEVSIGCIAHPRYRKDRDGRDKKESDLLSAVKPVELRKLFISDMKSKKSCLKAKDSVVHRYARLLKTPYPKQRSSIVEGLAVLLDLSKSEVEEKLDALRKLRSPSGDDGEKKRNGPIVSQDSIVPEQPSVRANVGGRSNSQKRARPMSLSLDAEYAPTRHESLESPNGDGEALGDGHSKGMSREERKVQQAMKLFARMEERQRERKKPRTGDQHASPRSAPPSRPKTPKSTHARSSSPRDLGAMDDTDKSEQPIVHQKGISQTQANETKSKSSVETNRSNLRGQIQSVKIVQPIPQQRSTLNIHGDEDSLKDAGKRERDVRRERADSRAPRRRDTNTPDNAMSGTNSRRRILLARERSHESKRRRANISRDVNRAAQALKEVQKRDAVLDFTLHVPGPSVLGSKRVPRERLSDAHRDVSENSEGSKASSEEYRTNIKERLLIARRRKDRRRKMPMRVGPSPMKKRYTKSSSSIANVVTAEMSNGMKGQDGNVATSSKRPRVGDKDEVASASPEKLVSANACKSISPVSDATDAPTLSVSMIVVSEKGSLPDKGHILESTRLVLPRSDSHLNGKDTNTALKKRRSMFGNSRGGSPMKAEKAKNINHSHSETATVPEVSCVRPSPPESPVPPRTPSPVPGRQSSPRFRSSPLPLSMSPKLRSVPDKRRKSPVPLPSFKSVKPAVTSQRVRSPSPEKAKRVSSTIIGVKDDAGKLRASQDTAIKTDETSSVEGRSKTKQYLEGANAKTPASEKESVPGDAARTSNAANPTVATGATLRKSISIPLAVPPPAATPPAPNTSSSSVTPAIPLAVPAPAPLRSIRSVPLAIPRAHGPSPRASTDSKDHKLESQSKAASPKAPASAPSSQTIGDLFQQRLQGFLKSGPAKPPAVSPTALSRGANPSSTTKISSPPPLSRSISKRLNGSPLSSVRGSAAKLSAALPLSSKPNLDSLRNSNGLSPRVSGNGMGYVRNSGSSFRSKSSDGERHWSSMPSFSSIRRQHSFGSSRGSSRNGMHGKNSNYRSEKHMFTHPRDIGVLGREGNRHISHDEKGKGKHMFGHAREYPMHGRDEDTNKNAASSPHQWNRSHGHRNGWTNGNSNGHSSHGDGGIRGSRRGHHAS